MGNPFECRAAILQYLENPPHTAIIRSYGEVNADDVKDATSMVQEALDAYRICANTIDVFGETWIMQGLENLPVIASNPGIGLLERSRAFAGLPMVIIASGPSLSKNIEQLRRLKGRALLITFSHSLGALNRAGIDPDLVLALDPEDLRYHFDGYDTTRPEALLLGATIHPGVLRLPAKRIFTFAANSSLDGWIYKSLVDKEMVATGGSVACSALSLGVIWGCSPLIFVGLDLSYPDGRVYADGIADDQARIVQNGDLFYTEGWSTKYSEMATVGGATRTYNERLHTAKGYYGGTVPTSFSFGMYRRWIESAIKQHRLTVWNCTEGGAYLENAEHIKLEDAIERLPTCDAGIPARVSRASVEFDKPEAQRRMLCQIREMIRDMRKSASLAARCCELIPDANDGNLDAIDEIKSLSKDLKDGIDKVGFVILANQKNLWETSEVDGRDEHNKAAVDNWQLVIASAARMIPILERSAQELE